MSCFRSEVRKDIQDSEDQEEISRADPTYSSVCHMIPFGNSYLGPQHNPVRGG
jgi:hypothetical protein